jgi:hypothetical protein
MSEANSEYLFRTSRSDESVSTGSADPSLGGGAADLTPCADRLCVLEVMDRLLTRCLVLTDTLLLLHSHTGYVKINAIPLLLW